MVRSNGSAPIHSCTDTNRYDLQHSMIKCIPLFTEFPWIIQYVADELLCIHMRLIEEQSRSTRP